MISQFCIKRPIFAAVLSILIVLVGITSIFTLPVDQYPDMAPPTVTVSGSYGGATADVTAESVSVPIEQEINGVPNMLYMSSTSSNGGSSKIKITFNVGTNPDFASIDVQNKVQQANSDLPEDVITNGVTVEKTSAIPLMTLILRSSEARYDDLYLSNYVTLNIQQALKRIPGVGKVRNTGARTYTMRIWLNPDALSAHGLTPGDVVSAVKEQNVNSAAGSVGTQPAVDDIKLSLTINAGGKLKDAQSFGEIIVKATGDGALIRLRDVARVELGASAYKLVSRHNGSSSAVIIVLLLPGHNALEVADQVKEVMGQLSKKFPTGISYDTAFDTTQFIKASIDAVVISLLEALLLVGLVVFVFLQNWRTTLIPMLAAPVSIIGTFIFLSIMGFTINTISLLAMVLAIGLVVDDAIVVVENVERLLKKGNLSPAEATSKAMKELTSALVATSLVLAAVFLPVAFLGGISGKLYREFALTLTVAVLISTFVALTLSPALCALLMKKDQKESRLFAGFNKLIARTTERYGAAVSTTMVRVWRSVFLYLTLFAIAAFFFTRLPVAFVPLEDTGSIYADLKLQPGTAVSVTDKVVKRIETQLVGHPAIGHTITLSGENLTSGSGEENAYIQFSLKPWDERDGTDIETVMADIAAVLDRIPEITYRVFQPPAIAGMGERSGFTMELQDRSGSNSRGLAEITNKIVAAASQLPEIRGVNTTLNPTVPMLKLKIDREMVKTLNISLKDLNSTLKQLTGSSTVSDFNLYGRTYKVKIQAEADFRRRPEDLQNYYIRSGNGVLVPLSILATFEYGSGPGTVTRHNLFSSATIAGSPAQGYSSGQAMAAMEKLADEMMPDGFAYEWSGMSLQEKKSGGQAGIAMLLAIVFVYLFLAALYESWLIPLSVLTIVPVALAGAIAIVYLRDLDNNIFFQIAMVSLIGLAAKNSILIVEFARTLYDEGMSATDAALEAARQRFRPILMTSFAFILGLLPLVLSSGPGAEARISISTGTLGGMIAATTIGILIVPMFFVLFVALGKKLRPGSSQKNNSSAPLAAEPAVEKSE